MTKQMSNAVVWAVVVMSAVNAQAAQQAAMAVIGVQVHAQERYVVGRAMPPDTPGAQRIDISLEQAIERALEKNLYIQREKLSPQMQDYTLAAARAAFKPTLNG